MGYRTIRSAVVVTLAVAGLGFGGTAFADDNTAASNASEQKTGCVNVLICAPLNAGVVAPLHLENLLGSGGGSLLGG